MKVFTILMLAVAAVYAWDDGDYGGDHHDQEKGCCRAETITTNVIATLTPTFTASGCYGPFTDASNLGYLLGQKIVYQLTTPPPYSYITPTVCVNHCLSEFGSAVHYFCLSYANPGTITTTPPIVINYYCDCYNAVSAPLIASPTTPTTSCNSNLGTPYGLTTNEDIYGNTGTQYCYAITD